MAADFTMALCVFITDKSRPGLARKARFNACKNTTYIHFKPSKDIRLSHVFIEELFKKWKMATRMPYETIRPIIDYLIENPIEFYRYNGDGTETKYIIG